MTRAKVKPKAISTDALRTVMEQAGHVRDSGNGDTCSWVRIADDVVVVWFTMSQGWMTIGKVAATDEADAMRRVLGEGFGEGRG